MIPSQIFAKDADGQYQLVEEEWKSLPQDPPFWEGLWEEEQLLNLDGVDTTQPLIAYLLEGQWYCFNVPYPLVTEPWNG